MAAEQQTVSKPLSLAQAPAGKPGVTGRLMSLDVFRGLTIASMIMVNNPGTWTAVYPPLRHAEWHGWTFTDTVFPFFLWIVGVAMTLSTAKRLEWGDSRPSLFGHAVRRALSIFGLGIFLTLYPYFHISTVRIPGVLQRIAVCYLIATVIYLTTGIRGQIVWTGGLLAAYWILMKYVPVPGFGAGVLTKEGNFSHWVDSLILSGHMYSGTKTWDPEGIASTLPAIATTMFGILTGHILRLKKPDAEKASWIFVMGSMLLFAGAFLNNYMPINKSIWTTPYSLFMAGMATLTFGCSYWLVDIRRYRSWARPFAIYGMNAIAVFVLSGLFTKTLINIKVTGVDGNPIGVYSWIFEKVFAPLAAPANASLAFALCYCFLFFLLSWFMYRRNWFVRI
jgi:predicted acyltransferase